MPSLNIHISNLEYQMYQKCEEEAHVFQHQVTFSELPMVSLMQKRISVWTFEDKRAHLTKDVSLTVIQQF